MNNQTPIGQNADVIITTDHIKVKKSLYAYEPKSYLAQLQQAAIRQGEMLDMTAITDENIFVNIENIIVEVAKEHFTIDRNYEYYKKDIYYRSVLCNPFRKFYGLDYIPDNQIFFGCGSYDLWKTLLGFVLADGKIIANSPHYSDFANYVLATGREFLGIFRNDFQFPTQEIIDTIEKEKEACACVLIDRPSNPTGVHCTVEETELILAKAMQYNIPVVIDEVYANYIPLNESVCPLLAKYKNLVWMRSNSKGCNIGSSRVGALVFGSAELANCFSKIHSPFAPDYFSVLLAKKLFEMGPDFLDNLRNEIKSRKHHLETELTQMGYFCLPSHPNIPALMIHKAGKNLVQEFANHGIEVRGAACYQRTIPILDDSYIRVRIQFDDEKIEKFLNAAKQIV